MASYSSMQDIARALEARGIRCKLPDTEAPESFALGEDAYNDYKRRMGMRHIRRIRAQRTLALLVVNRDRHGVPNYIGPSSFAEIAVAVAHYKPVYVYQNTPDFYREELSAWRISSLDGDLSRLAGELCALCEETRRAEALDKIRLRLFDTI